jgi:hypothetical protein
MIKKLVDYVLVYLMWIVTMLLGVWFIFLLRNALEVALRDFYVQNAVDRALQAGFIDRIFTITIGLFWLGLVIASEFYFRNGVEHGDLLSRFAKLIGPGLILIFGVDILLLLMQGGSAASWSRWVILASELFFGIGLFLFAKSPHNGKPENKSASV